MGYCMDNSDRQMNRAASLAASKPDRWDRTSYTDCVLQLFNSAVWYKMMIKMIMLRLNDREQARLTAKSYVH